MNKPQGIIELEKEVLRITEAVKNTLKNEGLADKGGLILLEADHGVFAFGNEFDAVPNDKLAVVISSCLREVFGEEFIELLVLSCTEYKVAQMLSSANKGQIH